MDQVEPAHWNQALNLELLRPLDPELLEQALQALVTFQRMPGADALPPYDDALLRREPQVRGLVTATEVGAGALQRLDKALAAKK